MDSPERLPNTGRDDGRAAARQSILDRRRAAEAEGRPAGFYKLESSQVKAIGWFDSQNLDLIGCLGQNNGDQEPNTGDLVVIFPDGATWQYAGVPRAKILGILTAASAGKYFNSEIKNHPAYTASKLSAGTKQPKPEAPAPATEAVPNETLFEEKQNGHDRENDQKAKTNKRSR